MIRHAVLFKRAKGVDDAGLAKVFSTLKDLQLSIPGILNITTGINCSPEGLQRGYTHAFTVDFVDAEARDVYLPHPAHQKVGAMIVAATEGGIDGILVLDWEV